MGYWQMSGKGNLKYFGFENREKRDIHQWDIPFFI